MPKILYIANEDWVFVSHFLPVAQAARQCGYQVAVATRVNAHGDRLKAEGFSVHSIQGRRGSLNPWTILSEFKQIRDIVRDERPDAVHCISLRPIVIGGLAARSAGARTLILAPTGLGHLWLERGAVVAFLRRAVRLVAGQWLRTARTFYVFENRDDPREFGLDPDGANVTIVGGAGVEPSDFAVTPEPPTPPLKVAVLARMIRPKGIAESVAAVERARAGGAAVELHLFGEPDPANRTSIAEPTLQQWSRQTGVFWHGHASDVAQIWRDNHVAMLLSYREGLPRTLVEAAAAGRPIVAADVPGCREVVRDGIEGILVPVRDAGAAARALAALAGDPALRARLGAAAHARFCERFTGDAVRATLENLYRRLGSFSDDAY